MPTDRFYRLTESKKKVISSAIRKEFARVSYDKASINQIVRYADISRGSFYTYFRDKQDAVNYVLQETCAQVQIFCEKALEDNGGEYFEMLKLLFDYCTQKLQEEPELVDILKHVACYEKKDDIFDIPEVALRGDSEKVTDSMSWLSGRVNRLKFRFQDENTLDSLLALGNNALLQSIRQYYHHPECLGTIRQLLSKKLDILCYGAYRNELAESAG